MYVIFDMYCIGIGFGILLTSLKNLILAIFVQLAHKMLVFAVRLLSKVVKITHICFDYKF